jgi:hypothetical protein
VSIDFMIFNGCAAVNPPSDELLRRPARPTLGEIAIVSSKLLQRGPGKFPSRLVHIPTLFSDAAIAIRSSLRPRDVPFYSKPCASRYALDRALAGLEYAHEIEIANHEFAAN